MPGTGTREPGVRPLNIEVLDPGRRLTPAQLEWLARHAERAAALLGTTGEVRAIVVDDAEMAELHEDYTGVEGTTDVLTFDVSDPELRPAEWPPVTLGSDGSVVVRSSHALDTDIVICFEEAERQVEVRKHLVEAELLLYVVHGVLHCLGFDDHDEGSAGSMHDMEDAVLKGIGVGAVYRAG